jgi:hypothetical protein
MFSIGSILVDIEKALNEFDALGISSGQFGEYFGRVSSGFICLPTKICYPFVSLCESKALIEFCYCIVLPTALMDP